jgi:hypothetical protein
MCYPRTADGFLCVASKFKMINKCPMERQNKGRYKNRVRKEWDTGIRQYLFMEGQIRIENGFHMVATNSGRNITGR